MLHCTILLLISLASPYLAFAQEGSTKDSSPEAKTHALQRTVLRQVVEDLRAGSKLRVRDENNKVLEGSFVPSRLGRLLLDTEHETQTIDWERIPVLWEGQSVRKKRPRVQRYPNAQLSEAPSD